MRYGRPILRNGRLAQDVLVLPSLTDFGDLRATSESALLVPLTSSLKLKLNLRVDFDDEPEFRGIDEWQTSVGASIRWDF